MINEQYTIASFFFFFIIHSYEYSCLTFVLSLHNNNINNNVNVNVNMNVNTMNEMGAEQSGARGGLFGAGGRFKGGTDPIMEKFNESISFDKR